MGWGENQEGRQTGMLLAARVLVGLPVGTAPEASSLEDQRLPGTVWPIPWLSPVCKQCPGCHGPEGESLLRLPDCDTHRPQKILGSVSSQLSTLHG